MFAKTELQARNKCIAEIYSLFIFNLKFNFSHFTIISMLFFGFSKDLHSSVFRTKASIISTSRIKQNLNASVISASMMELNEII